MCRLNMVLDAAKGMMYLHSSEPPVIHRDLKSPNLLVDKHWRIKVAPASTTLLPVAVSVATCSFLTVSCKWSLILMICKSLCRPVCVWSLCDP